jgi:SAM-dependent methyltransferase
MENDKSFDPRWRDDIYNEEALNIPLLLPPESEPNNKVWVSKKIARGEDVFGKYRAFKKPRIITAIVKKVRSHPGRRITDKNGNNLPEDSPVWDLLNPPKAWMSDKAEELMTMYAGAKEARGEVLVGGLGIGIYPQMALYLGRPVDSFTIVDNSPDVIEITTRAWLDRLDDDTRDKIDIIEQSFEDYIKITDKKFDTIFVDLWEDSDPRFLPYINRLVDLIKPLCKEGGRIYIWAYALAVDAFVQLVNFYESSGIDIQKIPARIDPILTKYSQWRARKENDNLPIDEYEKKARELALTVKLPDLEYSRDLYFFPHAVSAYDRHIIMQILNLARREKAGEENAAVT